MISLLTCLVVIRSLERQLQDDNVLRQTNQDECQQHRNAAGKIMRYKLTAYVSGYAPSQEQKRLILAAILSMSTFYLQLCTTGGRLL
jgi:hypothetical protein